MEKIKVALIGIGGFGNQYVRALLEDERREMAQIVAACDPRPEGCERLAALKEAGCVILADGAVPDKDAVAKAEAEEIFLLTSEASAYDIAKQLGVLSV